MLLYIYNASPNNTKIIPNGIITKEDMEQLLGRQMTAAESRLHKKATKATDVAGNCAPDTLVVSNGLIRILMLIGKAKLHFTKAELNLLSKAWERGVAQTAVSYETNEKSLLEDITKNHINVVIATSSADSETVKALKNCNHSFCFVPNAEIVSEKDLDAIFGQKPIHCLDVAAEMARELCN